MVGLHEDHPACYNMAHLSLSALLGGVAECGVTVEKLASGK